MVIPTFNRALLLKRAIESVFSQTVQCSELIIIDDGSTDNTLELLRHLSSTSKIAFHIYCQKNKGPAAARNLAVSRAESPYIAFLDSDDHWHINKLEKQYQELAKNNQYRISHTREKWLRKGQLLNQRKIHRPRHGYIFDHCLQLCAVGASTVMIKKEIFNQVGLFDESLRCCEDYDLWLRISCQYNFLLIDEALTVKEGGRKDQVSFQYRLGMDEMRIYSLRKLLDGDLLNCQQYLIALNEFIKKSKIFGNGCLKHGKMEAGHSCLELIPVYVEMAVQKFPDLREGLNA